MPDQALPEFADPPVVETVHGVQFREIKGLGSARLGAFWKSLGTEWPHVDDAQRLPPQLERFGGVGWGQAALKLKLQQVPNCRLMIRNAAEDRMIQLQNGQLHWNWLGRDSAGYPRYHVIKQEFDVVLARFAAFLDSEGLPPLEPNQWELTYLNHLPRGTVWNSAADWPRLFPTLPTVQTDLTVVVPESFGGEWHYEIPPRRGRLHVQIVHEKRENADERLVLALTARGPASDLPTLHDGLEVAHRTIVIAFKELTSDDAHRRWGLQP